MNTKQRPQFPNVAYGFGFVIYCPFWFLPLGRFKQKEKGPI